MRQAVKDFFAGGDVITGASNVSNAMAGGKQTAQKIDERLMGTSRWNEIFPVYHLTVTLQESPV